MKKYNLNYNFVYKKPKIFIVLLLIYVFLFNVVILFLLFNKGFSKKTYKGEIDDNKIVVVVSALDTYNLTKSSYVKIGDKKEKFSIREISEIYKNGNLNLQNIIINYKNSKNNKNQLVDVTFYYDYDYKIKKIVRGVLK